MVKRTIFDFGRNDGAHFNPDMTFSQDRFTGGIWDNCELDKIYMIPPDVKEAMDFAEAAATMAQHGVISKALYYSIFAEVTSVITKAAQERRIGVIMNLGT